MIHKTYTFRIYLNQAQAILINKAISCSRFVCNHFLSLWDRAYKETGKGLTYGTCSAKSREVEGRIVHATVIRNPPGRYFVSLLIETEVQELPKTHSYIGIDVGRKDFAILSDGTNYKNLKFFRSLEDKLAKAQHVLSRRMKGSSRWHNNESR